MSAAARWISFSAILVAQSSAMAYSEKATVATDLYFSKSGIALEERERWKIFGMLDQIRKADWCGVEVVIMIAIADDKEAPKKRGLALSDARISYVTELFGRHGVPATAIYAESKDPRNAAMPQAAKGRGAVQIEIVGTRGWDGCPFPRNAFGFRHFSNVSK